MKNWENLLIKLKKKKVFFFVGSGISLKSGLPSVWDILSRTCQKWIPEIWEDPYKKRILETVQPELFYSILLECNCGNTDCLGMWSSFHSQKWAKTAGGVYTPVPSIEHLFIAAYSQIAQVPIFTTNYDTMLEKACDMLGIPNKTLIFSDSPPTGYYRKTSQNLSFPKAKMVYICKVHGDIDYNKNEFDPNALKTTMAEITKRNDQWLRFLFRLLDKKSICFGGYSGRDIDYYPFIKEYISSNPAPSAFWMEERDPETIRNAEALGAMVIKSYPDKFFESTYAELFQGTPFADQIKDILGKSKFEAKNHKDKFLGCIQAEIQGCSGTMTAWHDLFWMIFSKRTGNPSDAHSYANKLSAPTAYKSLMPQHQIMVLDTIMKANREQAKFRTYRKNAWELFFLSKKLNNRTETYNAILQIIGSYQMEIPHHLCFKIPLRMSKIGMMLLVRLGYAALNTYFSVLKVFNHMIYNDNIHLIQECLVRTFAIDTALALKFPILKAPVCWRLKKLYNSAYTAGNFTTIIGTCKYLSRLLPEDPRNYKNIGESYAKIVSEKSAFSILTRGTDESLKAAEENSNPLNKIKTYLKIGHDRYSNCEKQLLSVADRKDMVRCMKKVESRALRRAFAYILRNYF